MGYHLQFISNFLIQTIKPKPSIEAIRTNSEASEANRTNSEANEANRNNPESNASNRTHPDGAEILITLPPAGLRDKPPQGIEIFVVGGFLEVEGLWVDGLVVDGLAEDNFLVEWIAGRI